MSRGERVAKAATTTIAPVPAGRSNVGKSTLVNQLTPSAPARAANKPGLTQRYAHTSPRGEAGLCCCSIVVTRYILRLLPNPGSINFYGGYNDLSIVDLPGYGFAFAQDEKKEQWATLLQDYISTRTALKRIYLLIDARHGMAAHKLTIRLKCICCGFISLRKKL